MDRSSPLLPAQVHIVGHLMSEEHAAGDLCAKRLHL